MAEDSEVVEVAVVELAASAPAVEDMEVVVEKEVEAVAASEVDTAVV